MAKPGEQISAAYAKRLAMIAGVQPAIRDGVKAAVASVVGGVKAGRAVARELVRPELQAHGVDHIDPFTPGGARALAQAKSDKALAAQSAKYDALDAWVNRWTGDAPEGSGWKVNNSSVGWTGEHPNEATLAKTSRQDSQGDWENDTDLPDSYYEERGLPVPDDLGGAAFVEDQVDEPRGGP